MRIWVKRIAIGLGALLGLLLLGGGAFSAWAVTTFEQRQQFPDVARPELKASTDPELIAAGKYLVHGPAHCSQCHSTTDRDHPEKIKDTPLHGGLEFAMGPIATTYAANLTSHAETGLGKISDADIARAIRSGVRHDGRLSFFMAVAASKPSDEDIIAILSYLRSLQPIDNRVTEGEWKPLGKIVFSLANVGPVSEPPPKHVPPADEPSIERGRYLSKQVMLCSGCHTAFDMGAMKSVGPEVGGSLPDPSHGKDTENEFVAPNLTADPTGVTGRMDEATFVARLRAGRVFASSIMPWECFQETTDSDLKSVYRYLKSLPPVKNDVGPTYRDRGWKAPE
jgi:mono/diheme cytochrome c family protein